MLGDERMKAAASQVIDKESTGDVGVKQCDGDNIAGREGLNDALVGAARVAIAGNLGNFKDLQVRIRMLVRIAHQVPGDLFGGGHYSVRKDAAPEGAGKVTVKNNPGEISTVVEEQFKVRAIRACVHPCDKRVVLSGSGLEAEGVDAPLIGNAHQLGPAAMRHIAGTHVRSQAEQMGFVIAVVQTIDDLVVHARGNFGGVLDRV